MDTRRYAIAIVLAVTASACMDPPAREARDTLAEILNVVRQGQESSGLAWNESGIIVTRDPTQLVIGGSHLWRVSPNGDRFQPWVVEEVPGCRATDYLYADQTGEMTIAARDCRTPDLSHVDLLEFDEAGNVRREARVDEPIGPFALDPFSNRAIVSKDSGLCSGLAQLVEGEIRELPVWVGSGEQRFRIDEEFRHPDAADCRDWGLASQPAWSPDGGVVAFFASPRSVGVGGFEKAESPWNLYLLDPDTLTAEMILPEIKFPADPSWSPDSRWLVFSGRIRGIRGAWLLRVTDGELRRIAFQEMLSHAWSPDGERLAVARPAGTIEDMRQDLLILDIRSVTESIG